VRPLAQGLNETTQMTDAKAFIGWLTSRLRCEEPEDWHAGLLHGRADCVFARRPQCPISRRVASFHGGGLANDTPNSPHLLAAKTHAQFLIAIAANDDQRSPNEKTVLKETFGKANLPAEIEV
jgi:carboxymethylenebutenolidase